MSDFDTEAHLRITALEIALRYGVYKQTVDGLIEAAADIADFIISGTRPSDESEKGN